MEWKEPGMSFRVVFSKKNSLTVVRDAPSPYKQRKFQKITSVKTSVKILNLIKSNNQITIPEIATIIGITKRSVERNIEKLQKEKQLRRIGPDKGGYWKIVKS